MPQLIDAGHIYIALPPLYKVKRGRQEMYLKDDEALADYFVNISLEKRLPSGQSECATNRWRCFGPVAENL